MLRLLRAFDQMGLDEPALLAAVDAWADARLAALSPNALALAIAGFARLRNGSPRLLATAAAAAAAQAAAFTPAQLARVCW